MYTDGKYADGKYAVGKYTVTNTLPATTRSESKQ